MKTVTIPKKTYKELVEKKLRYEYLRQIMAEDVFAPPSVRRAGEVVRAFRATKRYNPKFLESLGRGLKRSSYFRP